MNINLTRLFVLVVGVILVLVGLGLIIQSPANWFTDIIGLVLIIIGVGLVLTKNVPTISV